MDSESGKASISGTKKLAVIIVFCAACVLMNFIGSQIALATKMPLYFDSAGMILAGAMAGYIPGVVVGYLTNLFTTLSDPSSVYYCLTSVLIAVAATYLAKRGWLSDPLKVLGAIFVFALIGGGLGSIITWCLFGATDGSDPTVQAFMVQLGVNFLWDVLDKAITVVVAAAIFNLVPARFRDMLELTIWRQTPLQGEKLEAARRSETRRLSLRTKIMAMVALFMLIAAIVTTSISYIIFHRSDVESAARMGEGIAAVVAQQVDADRVDAYLANGEAAAGYHEAMSALADVRDSFPDVRYVYVYKILEDGIHVVLDPGTLEEEGDPTGAVMPFDKEFEPYVDNLLAGEPIEPIVTNGSYGWLLSMYQPVYNDDGEYVCYAAVDISMEHLIANEQSFLVRVIILFAAFFVLICVFAIWFAEYTVVMPINSIARASSGFAFDDETTRAESVKHLQELDIRTGDEIENLYHAVTKTSEDTMQFIADSQEKAATIERMQDNLIMVMADLVESRDQHTGDHVRKTAAYTKVIMEQMRREGIYSDVLTDEFMENVVKSAPLHDIGKIEVSDTILNKPGRLTDEEFAIMKNHTLAGEAVLEKAKGAMSEAGYLDEARRLAAYHHEKWNGAGYPYNLSGEDIPLSARIMAVADVFDALVSKRSYKDGMPIDKALSIIREDAGTHFDPLVAQAFLHAEAEVRVIAAQHGDAEGTAADIREQSTKDPDAPEGVDAQDAKDAPEGADAQGAKDAPESADADAKDASEGADAEDAEPAPAGGADADTPAAPQPDGDAPAKGAVQ